jgi:uncharacterized protein YcnI
MVGGATHLLGRGDEALDEHLAVAPVLELVVESELEAAHRGRVGDARGVVEVVRVGRDLVRDQHPVDADELLDGPVCLRGVGHGGHEGLHALIGRHGEAVLVHLPELGEPLVPELGVPCVVVAVGAHPELDVELWDGGHPSPERFEEAHLDPLVDADAPGGLVDGEDPRQLAPVPRCECGSWLSWVGHGVPVLVGGGTVPIPSDRSEVAWNSQRHRDDGSVMRRVAVVFGSLVLAGVPSTAWAHVSVTPASIEAGSTTVVTVTVPHGCSEASPTTRVRVQLPAGFTATRPTGPSGWTGTVASRIVTWSGPVVPSNRKLVLGVTLTAPASAGDVALPAVQTCEQGSTSWVQLAKAGAPEPERPAPMLNVRAKGAAAPTTAKPPKHSH